MTLLTEVDPAEVEQQVRDVMSRPEFSYEPSLLERLNRWLAERIEDLLGPGDLAAGGTFGGGASSLVAWLLIVVVVVVVVVVLVVSLRGRLPKPERDDTPATEVEVEHRRSASAWGSLAAELEQRGEWKLALRARYRELVRELIDQRRLPDVVGLTTGELRLELADGAAPAEDPEVVAAFDRCCTAFEAAWYAHEPTGAEQNARFRDDAEVVVSAHRGSTRRTVAAT